MTTRLHHKNAFYTISMIYPTYDHLRIFSLFRLMRMYNHCRFLVSALTCGIIKRREKLQIVLYSLLGHYSYEMLYSVINSISDPLKRHFDSLRLYYWHLNVSHPIATLSVLFFYHNFFTFSSSCDSI